MDPLTLGIAVCFVLGWICKEVGHAVANGYRAGANAGRAKTQKMRGSDNIGDNMLGAALDGVGAVIGGTVRGACAVGGAIGRGAKKGWQEGRAKGQEIRDNARAEGGRPRWRQLADWARDRAQGRPREGRSLRERLRDWWNEGREDSSVTQTDWPDDPPADGPEPPSTGGPDDGPGPTGPPPPIYNPWGNLAEFLPDDHPDKPAAFDPVTGEPTAPPPSQAPDPMPPLPLVPSPEQPEQPAADCSHLFKTHDHSTGTYCCRLCGGVWACTDHDHTDQQGDDMSAPTQAPSGEVTTFTQARQVAGQYHGQASRYMDEATSAKTQANQLRAELAELERSLTAANIGAATMGPVGGALEKARALDSSAEQLVLSASEAAVAANSVCEALDAHLGIYEAARANADGGDRAFHGGKAEK